MFKVGRVIHVIGTSEPLSHQDANREGVMQSLVAKLSRNCFTYQLTKARLSALLQSFFSHNNQRPINRLPSSNSDLERGHRNHSIMVVKTRQQARAQAGDSDSLEESREIESQQEACTTQTQLRILYRHGGPRQHDGQHRREEVAHARLAHIELPNPQGRLAYLLQ